ncbi:MAG: type II toxin-antitoxin system RelE/ParE family toxin [Caenispirillum sp.]|nr:type II toxin-antitoxin system RelE/ParE family toxin [Caenispirillum sp.]
MQVRYTIQAAKELKKIGPARDLIRSKILQYAADPGSLANNVKALKGADEFRLRVGDYRVLFALLGDGTITIMEVKAIRHRREAYD